MNHYAGHPSESVGVRHWKLSRFLSEKGFQVDIYAASTIHPSGRQRLIKGHIEDFPDSNGRLELKLIPCPSYKGKFGRLINMFFFGLTLLARLAIRKKTKPAVIIGSTVTPIAAIAALILAKVHKSKFVYEIRDLWPETFIRFEKMSSNSFVCKVLYWFEKVCWEKADLIISPLNGLQKYRQEKGYCEKEIVHIPNGVDLTEFQFHPRDQKRNIKLIYAGSLGEMYNLEPLIRALDNPNLAFLKNSLSLTIITDPCEQQMNLQLIADQSNIKRVHFESRVSRKILWERFENADALVLPLSYANGLYEFGASPNKIAEYMAVGKIVLQSCNYPGSPIIDNLTGILVKENSENDWVEGILRLVRIPDKQYKAICLASRDMAKKLEFEHLSEVFISAIARTIT